jgi:predicted DNA-binding protein (UPF0251 family)
MKPGYKPCGASTKAGGACQRQIPEKHDRCPQHAGDTSTFGLDKAIDNEAKRSEALRLKRAGFSFAEIGSAMGVERATAHHLVMRALSDMATSPLEAAELRELQRSRLERLLAAVWSQATAENVDLAYVDRAAGLIDRLIKLDGLNSPLRHEISGVNGGPIQVADITSDFLERVTAELDRRRKIAESIEIE